MYTERYINYIKILVRKNGLCVKRLSKLDDINTVSGSAFDFYVCHAFNTQLTRLFGYQYDTHYHMATSVVNCVEQFNENLKEHSRHPAARLPDEPVAPGN